MNRWIVLAFVALSLCLASQADAGCGRGRVRGAARAVGSKAVGAVRAIGRILPPWRR